MRHFCQDRAALAAARARLSGFRARGWAEVAAGFVAAVEQGLARPAPALPPPLPALLPGAQLAFSALDALLGPGFAPPEGGLAWMNARTATLRLENAGPVHALLHLAGGGGRLVVTAGEAAPRLLTLPHGDKARLLLDLPGGAVAVTLHLPGEGRCALRAIDALPAGSLAVPPRRAVRFGAGGHAPEWAPLAGAGFDLSGTGSGLPVLGEAAVLRLRVAPGKLRLLLLLEGEGTVEHPGGAASATPALLLALDTPDGELRLTLRPRGSLRLHALQWAPADDLEGRLALLEQAAPFGATLAERLAALEAHPPLAAAVPGGAAGWLARRLAPRTR